jgi:hypothetical protein
MPATDDDPLAWLTVAKCTETQVRLWLTAFLGTLWFRACMHACMWWLLRDAFTSVCARPDHPPLWGTRSGSSGHKIPEQTASTMRMNVDSHPDDGCLGARVLPRLPEQEASVHGCLPRETCQLGHRRATLCHRLGLNEGRHRSKLASSRLLELLLSRWPACMHEGALAFAQAQEKKSL